MPEKLGFICLGKIGSAMALKMLRSGLPMVVYDLANEYMEALTKEGAEAAASPGDVASKAKTIFLSLTTSAVVEQVCLGADGIADGATPDTLVVDLTSGDPTMTSKIAASLEEKSIHMIDAGVTGGASASLSGTLTIFVGGDGAVFERVRHVLEEIGSNIFHMGPIGTGHMTKALNNTIIAVNFAIACEATMIGAKASLDPEKLIAAFNTSGGRSEATVSGIPNTLFYSSKRNPTSYAMNLHVNNAANACQIGRDLNTPMFLSNFMHQILLRMQDEMGPDSISNEAVGDALEKWMGVSLSLDT